MNLRHYTAPKGQGASFCATREGGLALIEPLTAEARAWLEKHTSPEATWSGGKLVIEQRYIPGLIDGIIGAGFLFERDEDPTERVH